MRFGCSQTKRRRDKELQTERKLIVVGPVALARRVDLPPVAMSG